MTLGDLDPLLVAPKRLAAMGILAAASKAEFAYLRDSLDLSDSDLSKQLKALVDAGYASTKRTGKGKTRRSWFFITPLGTSALNRHAAALRVLLEPTALVPEPASAE